MPFINSKITKRITRDEEVIVKDRLGKASELIPGKSEAWLMVNFEPESHLYFKGSNDKDGIEPERIYVKYETTTSWGWNGGNF